MVLLKAIFRPDRLDAVKEALLEVGATGMTVTEVRGHGQQKGHTAVYRGKEYDVTLLPKMQVNTRKCAPFPMSLENGILIRLGDARIDGDQDRIVAVHDHNADRGDGAYRVIRRRG